MRLAVALVVVTLACGCGGRARVRTLALPRDPYLGLRCGAAPHCDTLGLAVWVRRRVRSVHATVAGHEFTLRTRRGFGTYAYGLFWEGRFRDHRTARTAGNLERRTAIRIVVVDAQGMTRRASAAVPVSPGYG